METSEAGKLKTMEYADWIKRERRIRMKILESSQIIKKSGQYRICHRCGEIVICHEVKCPNCNCDRISEIRMTDLVREAENRIRCRYRFDHIKNFPGK
ncbi:hypothetical protein D1BOALGB6SA_2536 [Olavius sp. associated proteobacterium Delta 1]|nr:hypothetical protein D1BOALGB6SA_2536 [Olavius sp. associated proteobacterium Delta 1]